MQNPNSLFELVKSLNATEKRYFQVYAVRYASEKNKSNYQRLFDDLNEWDVVKYNDAEFRKKFRKRSYIKNFAWEKNQLFELILKVMRNYRAGTDPEIRAHEMLIDVEFLLSKNRLLEAYRLLEKLYELAESAELFAEQMNVLNHLHNLNIRTSGIGQITADDFEKKENILLEKIRLQRQVRIYNAYLFEIDRNGEWQKRRAEAELLHTRMQECLDHILLPVRARLICLTCASMYHIAFKNYAEALSASEEVIRLLKKPENAFLKTSSRLISGCSNYLHAAMMLERFDLYPPILEEMRMIKGNTSLEEMELFHQTILSTILYMMNVKKYTQAEEVINQTREGMKKYATMLPEISIVNLYCNLAILCFFKRDFNSSLANINSLLDYIGRSNKFTFVIVLTRTLELMNHILLQEFDLADMKWRSYRRLVQQQSPSVVLDFVTESIGHKINQADNRPPDSKKIEKVIELNPTSPWLQMLAIMQEWPTLGKGNRHPQ